MRKAWTIEIILFLLYFSFGISWLAYTPVLSEVEAQFSITHTEAAAVNSAISWAKSFVPMLAGLLATRFGLYRTLLLGAGLASLSPLIPYSSDFKMLLILRFLFGIGGAMLVTLTGALVMQYFPREKMPFINGINNVAVNAGITTALFVTVPVTKILGWQAGLSAMGGLCLVLGILWAILGDDGPGALPGKARPEGQATFGDILRMKETWLIALAFTGPLCLYLSLNTFLPRHYEQAFGLSKAAASQLTGLFNLVGIPTAICAGLLTQRLGLRRPLIIAAGLLMPPASLGLVLSPEPNVRLLSAIFLGISLFLYVSPLFTIPMELPGSNAAQVAMMNGVIYSGAYILAGAAPMIVGKIADQTGSYSTGLTAFALFSSVLALAGWLLPETGKGSR